MVFASQATVQLAAPPRCPALTRQGPILAYGPRNVIMSRLMLSAGAPRSALAFRPRYMTQAGLLVAGSKCPGCPYRPEVHAAVMSAEVLPGSFPAAAAFLASATSPAPTEPNRCRNTATIGAALGSPIVP